MKVFTKFVSFVFILSLVAAGLSACGSASATKSSNSPDNTIPKSDYPPAPSKLMEADLTKLDGTTFKLNDYKGKVLIVNAWATWCGPCRQEMPELDDLQTEFKDKGLIVIGLNVDDDESIELIKDFGKEMGVGYDLVKGKHELFLEFLKITKKDAIPQSFLIDREGKLVGVFVGSGGALKKLLDGTRKLMNS